MLPLLLLFACKGTVDDTASQDDSSSDDSASDDSGSQDSQVPVEGVALGETCPPLQRIGEVTLSSTGYAGGRIFDAPQPFTGVPTLDGGACVLHVYDPSACGPCTGGQFCNGEGECVDPPRAFTDLVIEGQADNGDSFILYPDPQSGWTQGEFGDANQSWALSVSFGAVSFEVPALAIGDGQIEPSVRVQVDAQQREGALDAEWNDADDGSLVRSVIPINHHAHPGTFTLCEAPRSAGSFHADAELIEPLTVVTGLEFQGLEHAFVAAVTTPLGCVEVRAGTHVYVSPVWEG